MRARVLAYVSLLCAVLLSSAGLPSAAAGPTTYYVSISQGNDTHNGLSPAAPLATVSKVNALHL